MTIYIYDEVSAAVAANPAVNPLASFNPFADVLVFGSQSAASVRLRDLGSAATQLGLAGPGGLFGPVVLPLPIASLTSGDTGFIKFLDGSLLVIGDAKLDFGDDSIGNQLVGGMRNDHLRGLDGADTIAAGDGNDLIYGNAGGDLILGSLGRDSAFGGLGDDTIAYASGDFGVLAYGNLGDDSIGGTVTANDTLYGGIGDDTIHGQGGSDRVYGNAGADLIYGDGDSDSIFAGQGDDTVFGGSDDSGDVLYGNLDDDRITGSTGASLLFGGQGDDTIIGQSGEDSLFGNTGDDSLISAANDSGLAYFDGGSGNDSLTLSIASNTAPFDIVSHAIENIALIWTGGNSTAHIALEQAQATSITADALSSAQLLALDASGIGDGVTLIGGHGADSMTGSTHDDVISGGDGFDLLIGGDGQDHFLFASGEANAASNSVSTIETIADFNADDDVIQFTDFADAAITFVDGTATDFSAYTSFDDILTFTNTTLAAAANSVTRVIFNGTSLLVFNDSVAGASAGDQIIALPDFTGTLGAGDFMGPA